MYWYGWIPILTSRLIISKSIKELKKDSESTGTKNEYLLLPKIDQSDLRPLTEEQRKDYRDYFNESIRKAIKSHIVPSPDDDIYYYLKDFDDKNISELCRVAIVIGIDGFIKRIGLFGFPQLELKALAEVESIESTGLLKYKLLHGEPHIYANQLFAEVRDVYHTHIYAPHGDLALRPVQIESGNRDEAIEQIFHQYQIKILDYHSTIKDMMNRVEKAYGIASQRNFQEIEVVLSFAKGEMAHALSFVNLFDLPKKEENSIRNCLESLSVLSLKSQSLLTLKSIIMNWKIIILTIIATAYATFQVAHILEVAHPWIITILSTIVVLLFIRFYSWQSTKRRKPPEMELDLHS